MVAPSSPRLGFFPEVNLSRSYLFRAMAALNDKRHFECGVLLREAIFRQLWAECVWKQCLPPSASRVTPPVELLKALRKSGHVDGQSYKWVRDIIKTANRACHAEYVPADSLRFAISTWHYAIDSAPCGEPVNRCVVPEQVNTWDDNCGFEPNANYDVDDCDDDEGGALVNGGAT